LFNRSPFFRPRGRAYSSSPPPTFHFDFIREHIKFSERQYQDLIKERPQVVRAASIANTTEAKLWDLFPAPFQCPHHVQRLGRLMESPKWFCGLERVVHKKKCVVYSIGNVKLFVPQPFIDKNSRLRDIYPEYCRGKWTFLLTAHVKLYNLLVISSP
ncbi:hypothetical protein MPER_04315, partial [Moniliophthora perniciosa FA553]